MFSELVHLWVILFVSLMIFMANAHAHDDLDLSIESVTLDEFCHANVTIKNVGRTLPESFYLTYKPVTLVLKKGHQKYISNSLSVLDKNHELKVKGGMFTFKIREVFSNNPSPFMASLVFDREFMDYGVENDHHRTAVDCTVGLGPFQGVDIIDPRPDIAVKSVHVDAELCEVHISFNNLTNAPLTEQTWDKNHGAKLAIIGLPSHEREADITLASMDPQRQFTNQHSVLSYLFKMPKKGIDVWRVGLWYVQGDEDFSNNTTEIKVPDSCRLDSVGNSKTRYSK